MYFMFPEQQVWGKRSGEGLSQTQRCYPDNIIFDGKSQGQRWMQYGRICGEMSCGAYLTDVIQ